MNLIIVESPTKAQTLKTFLGKNYHILASMGHVRDLPKSEFGVDVEKDFEPKYVIPTKAKKVISGLKKESNKADEIILATDEDREGESISWHLKEALKLKNPKRIVFHEITETAIKEALKNPRQIDMNLVNAQQARRILDRIVGYKLSPFLWKKIARGLSAGRVQSVAVRLVVEREREIEKFVPVEYWFIEALLKKQEMGKRKKETEFTATLTKKDGKAIDRLEIKNKSEADKILKDLESAEYQIEKIEKKETHRHPLPPFTTSTLQQAAWQKFRFPAKMTMSLAQRLYEQGYITYHRTDSLNLSQMSLGAVKKFIIKDFGEKYYSPRKYKAKKNAQEAHEAIRPTRPDFVPPAYLQVSEGKSGRQNIGGQARFQDKRQEKVYTLIWQRFTASQMAPAVFDVTAVEISAKQYSFGASGQMLKFDGFLKVYPMKFSENELPQLQEKEILELSELQPCQHFTEPPPRYNEASLIKTLEKYGIGRPSTYAPTLATIQERHYIQKNDQKKFVPTEIGAIVNDMLVQNFPEVVDIEFTAKMEEELDQVAGGKDSWQKTCRDFYEPFAKNLKEKYEDVIKEDLTIKTDKKCPECGKTIVEKLGRFGKFYACSGFPECKYTESLESEKLNIKCPKCKTGDIISKRTKRGKIFYGCNNYPDCDFALWDKPINEFCEKCSFILVQTNKKLVRCSNKACGH